jgi:DNA-binding MarR family transcriptional regulator
MKQSSGSSFLHSRPEATLSEHQRRLLHLARLFEQIERSIPELLERYVAPHGLSVLAWQALDKIGPLGENATIGAIGERIMVSPSTMTGIAARLEQAGLVVRRVSERDQRAYVLELTDKGRETVETISVRFFDDLSRALESIDVERLDEMVAAFAEMVEIVQRLLRAPAPQAG